MKRKQHISKVCRDSYLTLKNINRIRASLTTECVTILIQGLVTSQLDYCNSMLLGTHNCYILKLQRIQNMAARPICGLHKFDRVSASLQDLHWLKIHERIEFKVLVIIFKRIHGASQLHVRSLLDYNHGRTLRSCSYNLPIKRYNL